MAYQEMVYCPVSNSSSQKSFVIHDAQGFGPRRADDECDYRKFKLSAWYICACSISISGAQFSAVAKQIPMHR